MSFALTPAPRHQRVLAIVNGLGEGVGDAEIKAVGHPPARKKSESVIDARGGALKNVDGSRVAMGRSSALMHGGKWQVTEGTNCQVENDATL